MVAQAQDYLEKLGYAPLDTQGNKVALGYMLHLLAHCMTSAILPKAVRAVATILENEGAINTADMIVVMVM